MGELNYFLGISVKQNAKMGEIWIGQPEYTNAVLKKFGMENCKPVITPISSGTKLPKATDESKRVDLKLYQSVSNNSMESFFWMPSGLDSQLSDCILYALCD